jgi:hypothetical protein
MTYFLLTYSGANVADQACRRRIQPEEAESLRVEQYKLAIPLELSQLHLPDTLDRCHHSFLKF